MAAATGLVDTGLQAADAYGRTDLAQRLRGTRDRLADPDVRVLVVGEFKQGKSTLVNVLLNAGVCPVDDDIATCVPTIVRYGEELKAVAYFQPPPDAPEDATTSCEEVPVSVAAQLASEIGNPRNQKRVAHVEVFVPRQILQGGLSLVDTPGVGGLGSAHGRITAAVLPSADAVILVSDASQEYTEPELSFLAQAAELCPTVLAAVSKIDIYPEWRKIAELDRRHLDDRDFEQVPVIPVSSTLREVAVRTNDADLNVESGFSALAGVLRDEVLTRAQGLAARRAATDVLFVATQLEAQFGAEREALADPDKAAELVGRLERTQREVDELRGRAARWQTTLSDNLGDLNADVEHDLRDRMRSLQRTTEEMIDDDDPSDMWAELEPWVEQAMATEVAGAYQTMYGGIETVAERVAEHFGDGEAAIFDALKIHHPESLGADVRGNLEFKRLGAVGQGFSALRGSYGGFLMFSMASQMVGLAALNPAVGILTFFVGRKSLREEKERQLNQRRAQAKAAVRTYVDDVNFLVSKDVRDTLRRVQRSLRDAFTERAEELQRSTSEAIRLAQDATQRGDADRRTRLVDVEAELGRIRWLADQARAMGPEARGRDAG